MGPSGAPVGSQMGAQRLARTEDRVRIRADIYAKTALTAKTGCGALLGSGPRHQVHPAGQREAWVKLVPSRFLMLTLIWRSCQDLPTKGAGIPVSAQCSHRGRVCAARFTHGYPRCERYLPGRWWGLRMRSLMRRAAVVAGVVVVLLGPAVGAASAAGRVGAGTRPPAGARTVSGGSWGTAIEVPGTAPLNTGGDAQVSSVSCASAGNCSAGGYYSNPSDVPLPFVVSQARGTWGQVQMPSLAALAGSIGGAIDSVSCASAGNCSAGGDYVEAHVGYQAIVVNQVNGVWGKAKQVPGTGALNQNGAAVVDSVSCASAGNCSAGGWYTKATGSSGAFVASQVNGTWGKAHAVLATSGGASILSVSCASAGNCSAGGTYYNATTGSQAFVVSQVRGTWGKAIAVTGTGALYAGFNAQLNSVSCASAGNCSAGGTGQGLVFVVSQVNGIWGQAKQVPGTATLNTGNNAQLSSVSCASAGNCSAGGYYTDSSSHRQAFVVIQDNGTWGTAEEVPGTATLNTGNNAQISSVSCASAGNCSAGGTYATTEPQAFVVDQANGTWGTAEEVPGTATLGQSATVTSVSCAPAGGCAAGGYYWVNNVSRQAFVVSRT